MAIVLLLVVWSDDDTGERRDGLGPGGGALHIRSEISTFSHYIRFSNFVDSSVLPLRSPRGEADIHERSDMRMFIANLLRGHEISFDGEFYL